MPIFRSLPLCSSNQIQNRLHSFFCSSEPSNFDCISVSNVLSAPKAAWLVSHARVRGTYLEVFHDYLCESFREFRLAIPGSEASERELRQNRAVLRIRLWKLSVSRLSEFLRFVASRHAHSPQSATASLG